MDSGGGNFKIEKLTESNFHVWKKKLQYVLAFRDLHDHISEPPPPSGSSEHVEWQKLDAKAQAVIGLTLDDDHLDHVSECISAASMWSTIMDLFQRKTLLNKLTARRRFYSAKMAESEKAMGFISRVRQLAADCKAMGVVIENQDIAMTVLCGLPQKYEHLIVAIDAVATDETLTLDFVKSRLLQEEQRMIERGDVKPTVDSALVHQRATPSQRPECGHCGKLGHTEPRCWEKYPHLRPKRSGGATKASGMVAKAGSGESSDTDDTMVCLMARVSNDKVNRASSATWVIDSGATSHICFDRHIFSDLEIVEPFEIKIGDSSGVKATGRGSVELLLSVSGKSVRCKLENVVYAPTMAFNMLSVGAMARGGKRSVFLEKSCYIEKDGRVIAEGCMSDGLYCLKTHTSSTKSTGTDPPAVALAADVNLWHQRLAHVHVDGIRDMVKRGVVQGVVLDKKAQLRRCKACVYGKSTRAPIPRSGGARAAKVLDLVHTDVCGPLPEASIGGSLYFVTFIDDHSRFAWVYPIQSKSDVFNKFKSWLAMVENAHETKLKTLQVGRKLKVLHSDNGGEYLSTHMRDFLRERGIQHRLTAPGNPHQNGIAERLNRTLIELVRSMLHQKQMEKKFWAEALAVAVHVRNRVTTRGLSPTTTPYEVMFGKKPNMSYLRVFGSRCWYNLRRPNVDKLDPRAREAVMIGYARGIQGYKLWDVAEQKVVATRDVRFDELDEYDHSSCSGSDAGDDSDDNVSHAAENDAAAGDDDPSTEDVGTLQDGDPEGNPEETGSNDNDNESDEFVPDAEGTEEEPPAGTPPETTRRSNRTRRAPGAWWASVASSNVPAQNSVDELVIALISSKTASDPRSYSEAVKGVRRAAWMKSMTSEHDSLMENECWVLVPRPKDANVIRSMWVYKTKEEQTEAGTLGTREKSRVCACGNGQVEGVDYSETYAPVVKLTSIRVVLAVVVEEKLLLHQMDFVTAFLNGVLDEVVYMEQPRGFEVGDPRKVVCRLLKSIYGLKQSPRAWYSKIDDFFIRTLGMERNPADDCVYVRRKGGHILIIALYVDDLLIACSCMEILTGVKQQLSAQFKMKDLGESRIILGMDISRDREAGTLSLSQTRYALKVIDRFGLESARGHSTPMDPALDLTAPSEPTMEPYREAIGCLMYLMVGTRPDLAYSICTLAKYVQNPTKIHWDAVVRVIRYVIHTKDLGLLYGGTEASVVPSVYVDADWAGDPATRKSMSGYVAMMSGGAVAWCARQQEVVATSSAESEYISMCNGAKETVWLRRLVAGLQVVPGMTEATIAHVDNKAAIALGHSAAVNRRNKHIDVRFHYTRQVIDDGELEVQYCPTEEMLADLFTKALGRVKLQYFVRGLGMQATMVANPQLPRGGM